VTGELVALRGNLFRLVAGPLSRLLPRRTGQAVVGGAEGPGVAIEGRLLAHETGRPLVGARVLVRDHPALAPAVTGTDGVYRLRGLPAHADLAVRIEARHKLPLVFCLRTSDEDWPVPPLELPWSWVQYTSRPFIGALDGRRGGFSVTCVHQARCTAEATGVAGARVELRGGGGRVTYLGAFHQPVPWRSRTAASGGVLVAGLLPGNYEVAVTHPAGALRPCVDSWAGSTAELGRVRVEAGALSDVRFHLPARLPAPR